MADIFSSEKRSKIMSSIRAKNTKPEIAVRKALWSMGKRYRIHDKTIMGTPDISNKKKNVVVFIDGCFWHGCKNCYKEPRTNVAYWRDKISSNKRKRLQVLRDLQLKHMKILQFWEHDVRRDPSYVASKVARFL